MHLSYQRPFKRGLHHGRTHHAQHAQHGMGDPYVKPFFPGMGDVSIRANYPGMGAPGDPYSDAIRPLTGFGWEWRQDGVILTLTIDNTPIRVFVPLLMIWEALHHELAAVGCPMQTGMGEPMSVGGLFSSISHAVSSVAHAASSAYKAVVPKAVQKAASSVVQKAASVGKTIVNSKIIRYGLDAAAVAVPALAPAALALEAAHQALEHVNAGIAAAKAIKNGVVSAANVAAATLGLNTQHAVAQVVTKAQAGNTAAQKVVGAFQQLALTRAAAASPNPHAFLARVVQAAPHVADVHKSALLQVAQVAQQARAHALRPYRVTQHAA